MRRHGGRAGDDHAQARQRAQLAPVGVDEAAHVVGDRVDEADVVALDQAETAIGIAEVGEYRGRAGVERDEEVVEKADHAGHARRRVDDVGGGDLGALTDRAHDRVQRVVRVDDTLGLTGGAGGVHDEEDIVGAGSAAIEIGSGKRRRGGEPGGEIELAGMGAVEVDENAMAQRRQAWRELAEQIAVREPHPRRGADVHHGLGARENELDLAPAVIGRDRCDHGADPRAREGGSGELPPRRQLERDDVFAADAERDQGGSDMVDLARKLAVGHRDLILGERARGDHGRLVGRARGGSAQVVDEGGVAPPAVGTVAGAVAVGGLVEEAGGHVKAAPASRSRIS